jgi:hypothetical protein
MTAASTRWICGGAATTSTHSQPTSFARSQLRTLVSFAFASEKHTCARHSNRLEGALSRFEDIIGHTPLELIPSASR